MFCTQSDKRPYYDFRRICALVYPFDIVLASGHHHTDPTTTGVVDSAAFAHLIRKYLGCAGNNNGKPTLQFEIKRFSQYLQTFRYRRMRGFIAFEFE